MDNKKYIAQQMKRKKEFFRYRLGILQLIYHPLLNTLLFPIIALFVVLWIGKNKLLTFNIPEFLLPVINYLTCAISIIIPIIAFVYMLKLIGEISAREDEATIQCAFDEEDLKNGCPILISKRKIKGGVTMREFYSFIPFKTWNRKQDIIADNMDFHYVESIKYGGKSNSNGRRIIIFTAPGRTPVERGNLYDEEF